MGGLGWSRARSYSFGPPAALTCRTRGRYVRFGERDQLSFAYVLHVQRPRVPINLMPRRYHWSATVEDDTADCYNATVVDTQRLAFRFQHSIS